MKKFAVFCLAALFTLTGCGSREISAKPSAAETATQGQYVNLSNRSTGTGGATLPEKAQKAIDAYTSILEPYRESMYAQAITSDMDGDGIPELILLKDKLVTVYDGKSPMSVVRMFYDVYTYTGGGVKTLVSDRDTQSMPTMSSEIQIGVDRVDGVPAVVTICYDEPTDACFGEIGYKGEFRAEALNPFTGKVLSTLSQTFRGRSIVAQTPENLFQETRRFSELELDDRGVLTFPLTVTGEYVSRLALGQTADPSAVVLETAKDLEKLRNDPYGSFVLTRDITLDNSFQPFDAFYGTLDGQGHWIKGLQLKVDGEVTNGLFASLGETAVIKELKLQISATVKQAMPTHISGLAGSNSGTISNCLIQSEIIGGTDYRPIASYNGGSIEGCTVVTAAENVQRLYGFVSENYGSIRDCQLTIQADDCENISALAYRNWEAITGCTVSVEAEDISNFLCTASQNYAPIQNCEFTATLKAPKGTSVNWSIGGIGADDGYFDSSNKVDIH